MCRKKNWQKSDCTILLKKCFDKTQINRKYFEQKKKKMYLMKNNQINIYKYLLTFRNCSSWKPSKNGLLISLDDTSPTDTQRYIMQCLPIACQIQYTAYTHHIFYYTFHSATLNLIKRSYESIIATITLDYIIITNP